MWQPCHILFTFSEKFKNTLEGTDSGACASNCEANFKFSKLRRCHKIGNQLTKSLQKILNYLVPSDFKRDDISPKRLDFNI